MSNSGAGLRPAPLRAYLLGRVRLAVGERTLPDQAWSRRSARALLLLLLATPGHELTRDQVLDRLWPESAPDAAADALYQALRVLRRVLEPDLSGGRGRDSTYVQAS